jgi:hypothetical protein
MDENHAGQGSSGEPNRDDVAIGSGGPNPRKKVMNYQRRTSPFLTTLGGRSSRCDICFEETNGHAASSRLAWWLNRTCEEEIQK